MRTTITLNNDVYKAARTLSRAAGKPLGKTVSEMARRALRTPPRRTAAGSQLPRFSVPRDAPMISLEAVRRAWEEDF